MAKYTREHSCGHESTVQAFGKNEQREYFLSRYFDDICESCKKEEYLKKISKENEDSAKKALDQDLPLLVGSEKQIIWATTIRQNLLDIFNNDKFLKLLNEAFTFQADIILNYILVNRTHSSFYIDNRFFISEINKKDFAGFDELDVKFFIQDLKLSFFAKICESITSMENNQVVSIEKQMLQDIKNEFTVFPENTPYKEAAEITGTEDTIKIKFIKDDNFIKIVKDLGYKWNSVIWEKKVNPYRNSVDNLIVEVGSKLLVSKIPVTILNLDLLKKAVDAKYTPECKRFISLITQSTNPENIGKLAIQWLDNSDMYDEAKKLPGAKWSNPHILVKSCYYDEIQDFAKMYNFKITEKALSALEQAKNLKETQLLTPITDIKTSNVTKTSKVLDIPLKVEIAPEFLDNH